MARHAEFDRTRALEGAMKLFWARGYVATSLAQLLDAMGIARSSFYASFGDKRSVFIDCLDLFAERTLQMLDTQQIAQAPETAAAEFFEHTLFTVSTARRRHGCMMVNAILELADVDSALSRRAVERLDAIERRFESLFGEALASGRLDVSQPPAALAQYVMTINQGLRVQSRKGAPPAQLREIVDTSLAMVGLATGGRPAALR